MKKKGVGTMSHISNMEFITTLNKYIPSLVLQQLIMRFNSQKGKENSAAAGQVVSLPELQPMETVVLFADISGFTNLGEACAKKGARGNEELAFCINRYMEGMVTNLDQYGGDIIKFVGDAMIVMWPPVPVETLDPLARERARIDTIRRAIQCSQGIQKHMNNLQILKGATLSVKIGIGFGQSSILYVGGVFKRSESFTIGEALMQALKSEGNASSGGQIIVAEEAFKHVREFYKGREIVNEVTNSNGQVETELFYHIDNKYAKSVVQIKADAMKLRAQYSTDLLARIQQQMQASVPQSIIPYLKIDQERFGSENRFLTVMFVSLGIELSSAKTPEGMNSIQNIMTAVQQQVYRLQGSLNKLVMDDKGSTLICLFGLMPFSHEDDASRAVAASFNLIKTLNRINNTYCNIGISSGSCFSGVVGTSGSRKEFSVLGDVVNLAARIMGSLKQDKLKNAVRCDLNTKILASNVFDFEYHAHKEFKGKSFSTPTFTPIHPKNVGELTNQKVLSPDFFLKLHMNPLILEKNQPLSDQFVKTIGFEEIIMSLQDDILNFSEDDDPQQAYLAVVKGQIGSGKTAMVRHLIQNLHESVEFSEYLQENNNKLPIFASSINPETQLHILNAWKPILQMMLTHYCKKQGAKRETFLNELILLHNQENKTDLLCKIFNVSRTTMCKKFPKLFESKQIQPIKSPIQFIKRPEYQKSDMEDLIEIIKNMVKIFIGEHSEVSGFNENGNFGGTKNGSENNSVEGQITCAPHMVFIDNANSMDDLSWALLEEIIEDCYKISIVIIMQTDSLDRLKISKQDASSFEKVWQNLSISVQITEKELPRLDPVQLCQLIVQNSRAYHRSYQAEIKERTRIIDPQNTIKKESDGLMWTQRLTKEWQLETLMTDVDQEIMNLIAMKCLGNPLMSLQYFVNMLHNGFVVVESDGFVSPTDKFSHCLFINDWTSLPVPNIAFKINCTLLDEFYYSVMVKGPQVRPGELETCTTNIVLLKSASVLGEEFELKALKRISPFPKNQSVGGNREEHGLRQLEQNDFIEIVDETDQRNILCRFNKCFMRECVYQILLYKSCKKDLHAATELYLQSVPLSKDRVKSDTMIAQLFEHMLLAQDATEESELYLERRTALNVMRIQNLISHKPKGFVLKEIIHKQGEKLNKKTEQRLVTLTTKELKWYHDEREMREGQALGEVELNFIYQVMKSSQVRNERPTFLISVTMYKKNGKEMPKRDIAFSCDTEEARDKWIIAIDFLKTKAIYDAYAKKNQCVNLAMQYQTDQEEKGEMNEEHRDNSNLLYDFGGQFKQLLNYGPANSNINTSLQKINTLRGSGDIAPQRKSSIFKPSIAELKQTTALTASDIYPRLKILYNMNMLSFLNHLDQGNFKHKTMQIAQITSSKVNSTDLVKMQLPVSQCGKKLDHINKQIIDMLDKDSELNTPNNDSYAGRTSFSSLQAQQQVSSLQRRDSASNRKRRSTSGNDLNEKRRQSALSADNLLKQSNQSANWPPQNELIKEVDEDVSSAGESVKFGGGGKQKKSKDFQKKASRIQSEHLVNNHNHNNHDDNSSAIKNKDALKQTTSESSENALLSQSLNQNMSAQMTRSAKPQSSSNKFTFDLIQQNSKEPHEELRSQKPIEDKNLQNLLPKQQKMLEDLDTQNKGDLAEQQKGVVQNADPKFSRENRQTFANTHQDHIQAFNVHNINGGMMQPIISEQDMIGGSASEKSQNSRQIEQNFGQKQPPTHEQKSNNYNDVNEYSGNANGNDKASSQIKRAQSNQFDQSNKEIIDFYSGKEKHHQKQLSSIHNQNDSAIYRDNGGKEYLIDPLNNASFSRIESSGNVPQNQSLNLNQAQNNNNSMSMSEDTQKTLVASLSSIIKKSFGQGISDLFTPLQEQIKTQQEIQKNLLRQQRRILRSSMSQNNNTMLQNPQILSQSGSQVSRDGSRQRKQKRHHQQAQIENIQISKRLHGFATPTRHKPADHEPTQPLFLKNATVQPPQVLNMPNHNMGSIQVKQPSLNSSFRQQLSDEHYSSGGITSVHSHKNLQKDSRIIAKHHTEDNLDQPPPCDDLDIDGPDLMKGQLVALGKNNLPVSAQNKHHQSEVNMQEYFKKKIEQVKHQQNLNQLLQLRQQPNSVAAGYNQARERPTKQIQDQKRRLFGSPQNDRDIYSDNDAVKQYKISLGEVGTRQNNASIQEGTLNQSHFRDREQNYLRDQEEEISQKTLKPYGSHGRRFYSMSNATDLITNMQIKQHLGQTSAYNNYQNQGNDIRPMNELNQQPTEQIGTNQVDYITGSVSQFQPNSQAVTLNAVQDLNLNQHFIPQGQLVRVVEAHPQAGICSVEFNGVTDIYRISEFLPLNLPQHLQQQQIIQNGQYQGHAQQYNPQPVQITQRTFYPQQNQRQNAQDANQLLLMSQGLISMDQESTRTRIVGHRTKAGAAQGEKTIEGISPVNAYDQAEVEQMNKERPNFFKERPEKEIEGKISQVNSKHLAVISKRFLDEDKKNLKAANLKLEERQKRKIQSAKRAEVHNRTISLSGQKVQKSSYIDSKSKERTSKHKSNY